MAMASAVSLSEPQVLAHTKRRLFPDSNEPDTYAVTDTQFATETWLSQRPIPEDIRSALAPFNHVQLGSGYPDLVGVRLLDSELLAVERFGDQPPLIAVEAKGHAEGAPVDVERGIVQAYDRLHEANAAYTAAPSDAISPSARTLARELNVGVLGVADDGTVIPVEVPRVVGNRTSSDATAIRFQATAQGVANRNFPLNHPKNYLAYPLALYHEGDTDAVLADHVVDAADSARKGAAFLGLVEERPDRVELSPLGAEVLRFALNRYDSVDDALRAFEDWKGSPKRFCELAPQWGELTRRVMWSYPATQLLVEELQTMHRDRFPNPSLADFVEWLHRHHSTFTVEFFLKGTETVRSHLLKESGGL